ncbi:MAG TPA: hypothetical protein VGS07_10125 [Thermoanaerobaculia bacterium]|jgi:hypothetical protein|nr:hypothetical protein [Thermoanaerobaculia bacterium]
MSKLEEANLVNPTMVIEVVKLNLGPGSAYVLHKPEDEGRWMNHYDVAPDGVVQVTWNMDGPPRPSYIEFYCSFDSITGVGFSECKKSIERYTLKGPCGGCFFLSSDIPAEAISVIVENWGHQRRKNKRYHFALWLGSRKISFKFDPQIYNDGVIHDPDGNHPKGKKRGGKKDV